MRESRNKLTEKEMELARMLMSECNTTADVQSKLKRLFAGTIEQMLEAEMDEYLGYEKNSVLGNNSGNSRNGYGKKTIISDYGECEISVPRDRNGEFEPKVIEKRQTRTDEIEQKINAMYDFFVRSFDNLRFISRIRNNLRNHPQIQINNTTPPRRKAQLPRQFSAGAQLFGG